MVEDPSEIVGYDLRLFDDFVMLFFIGPFSASFSFIFVVFKQL